MLRNDLSGPASLDRNLLRGREQEKMFRCHGGTNRQVQSLPAGLTRRADCSEREMARRIGWNPGAQFRANSAPAAIRGDMTFCDRAEPFELPAHQVRGWKRRGILAGPLVVHCATESTGGSRAPASHRCPASGHPSRTVGEFERNHDCCG